MNLQFLCTAQNLAFSPAVRTWYWFLSDEGPMLETFDYTIRIGSTPTFLYFDLYLYSAYAAHYVYLILEKFFFSMHWFVYQGSQGLYTKGSFSGPDILCTAIFHCNIGFTGLSIELFPSGVFRYVTGSAMQPAQPQM